MVSDLTGLPTANASLLDEATAAAEAMTLVRRANRKNTSTRFVVDADCLPQTIAVVRTRAAAMGIEVDVRDVVRRPARRRLAAASSCSTPGASGRVRDPRPVIDAAHAAGALAVVATDLLALTMLESPGAVGRRRRARVEPALRRAAVLRRPARRLHGGPRRARAPPARPAGRGLGRRGRPARVPARPADPRAAHPPRQGDVEHLHRAGAAGRRRLDVRRLPRSGRADAGSPSAPTATRRCWRARRARRALGSSTTRSSTPSWSARRGRGRRRSGTRANDLGLHLGVDGDRPGAGRGVRGDDPRAPRHRARGVRRRRPPTATRSTPTTDAAIAGRPAPRDGVPRPIRSSTPTTPRRSCCATCGCSSDRDYALDRGMIPLGSCTMKLNATAEMEPISYPGFADLHPFAPAEDAAGYLRAGRASSSAGWPRSPATRRCRSSRTPGRRASWPGCSRSAATTTPTATSSATSA